MTPTVVCKIALDVLGLHFLHDDLRVMHRDVKPANILLNREGKAKLADLGIVTLPGEVVLALEEQGSLHFVEASDNESSQSCCLKIVSG
jgi:serine/threonine protein kinase